MKIVVHTLFLLLLLLLLLWFWWVLIRCRGVIIGQNDHCSLHTYQHWSDFRLYYVPFRFRFFFGFGDCPLASESDVLCSVSSAACVLWSEKTTAVGIFETDVTGEAAFPPSTVACSDWLGPGKGGWSMAVAIAFLWVVSSISPALSDPNFKDGMTTQTGRDEAMVVGTNFENLQIIIYQVTEPPRKFSNNEKM